MVDVEKLAIANIAPDEARRILERTCDRVKLRVNSNGEYFGGEIMDPGARCRYEIGANHIEILETRSLLVHSTELRARGISGRDFCKIATIGFRSPQPRGS